MAIWCLDAAGNRSGYFAFNFSRQARAFSGWSVAS
jgi:hypothetical protein